MSDFKIPPINQGPSVEKLQGFKKSKDFVQLEKSAKEFEGFFTDMVMKSMRDTVNEPDAFGGTNETKFFQSMLDTEYSKMSSAKGNIGLAAAIVKQLAPHLQKSNTGE